MSALKNFYHDEICARPEQDEPDIDVCQNCGAYFEWLPGQKYQRCGPCRVGLNDPAREAVSMNRPSKFPATDALPLGHGGNTAGAVRSPAAAPATPKMPCRECDGAGEAEYMALDETRYVWRPCHVCEGSGTEKPYCEVCHETLAVDLFCYACDSYPEGFVYVERIGPGRVAV